MPHDIEIRLPQRQATARALATIGDAGDTGILVLLGAFSMIDAVLVVLWGLM